MTLLRPLGGLRRTVPAENPRVRWLLISCAFLALVAGAVGQFFTPAKVNPFLAWVATAAIPAIVVMLLIFNRQHRLPLLVTVCVILYIESVLTASLFVIGMAFAILVPIIGVGLVQPYVRGWTSLAVYAGAGIVATISVALVEGDVPANSLDADQPILTVVAFGLVAAAALGLLWRAGERQVEALDAADREIAARGQAEVRLAETAATLQTLISSSPVATMALDTQGIVRVWNPAAERLFGWSEDDVVGHSLPASLAEGTETPALTGHVDRTIGGEIVRGERAHARHRDGHEVLIDVHADAQHDEAGRPVGTIIQAIDVTERSVLEAQLQQAQKMEAVGQLAGGIAHDINNTLTAVGGFAELIETSTSEDDVRHDARVIADAVGRARQLTRQLLAFARRSMLQPEVIDVADFLTSIQPILRRLVGADIDLRIGYHARGALVRVDPGQFEQAILNLAVNARDAMPNGGILSITTSRVRRSDPAGSRLSTSHVLVAVADTGHGVPPEHQHQVFEPFFTTKEGGKGSGLGLAMVYGFVTQSGGEVELRSSAESGTLVEIRLPEARGGPSVDPTAEGGSTEGAETILLIEDEPFVAELGRRILSRRGYRVLPAFDGPSAIEVARRHVGGIDLILSDVMMPGMRGPEVARRVLELHPEAAVLYASGYAADAIADRGVLPDGVELIEKPFTAAELGSRVRSVLDARTSEGTEQG